MVILLLSKILYTHILHKVFFDVSLTIQTSKGCGSTKVFTGAVRAGVAPSPSFSASPLDGCASVARKFTDQSTGTITSWLWSFGDGGGSTSKNPSYVYKDTGLFSVTLTVRNNGCSKSFTQNNYIHVKSPAARFVFNSDCAQPYIINFSDRSKAPATWSWDFGDGNTSTLKNPSNTYNAQGAYTVKLKVTGNGCTSTFTDTLYIISQKPSFTISPAKSIFCRNDTVTFTATNYDNTLIIGFGWNFTGTADTTQTKVSLKNNSMQYVYTSTGNYTPILFVKNRQFCYDTIRNGTIEVSGPQAQFTPQAPFCVGTITKFSNQSIPYTNTTIKNGIGILVMETALLLQLSLFPIPIFFLYLIMYC